MHPGPTERWQGPETHLGGTLPLRPPVPNEPLTASRPAAHSASMRTISADPGRLPGKRLGAGHTARLPAYRRETHHHARERTASSPRYNSSECYVPMLSNMRVRCRYSRRRRVSQTALNLAALVWLAQALLLAPIHPHAGLHHDPDRCVTCQIVGEPSAIPFVAADPPLPPCTSEDHAEALRPQPIPPSDAISDFAPRAPPA